MPAAKASSRISSFRSPVPMTDRLDGKIRTRRLAKALSRTMPGAWPGPTFFRSFFLGLAGLPAAGLCQHPCFARAARPVCCSGLRPCAVLGRLWTASACAVVALPTAGCISRNQDVVCHYHQVAPPHFLPRLTAINGPVLRIVIAQESLVQPTLASPLTLTDRGRSCRSPCRQGILA